MPDQPTPPADLPDGLIDELTALDPDQLSVAAAYTMELVVHRRDDLDPDQFSFSGSGDTTSEQEPWTIPPEVFEQAADEHE